MKNTIRSISILIPLCWITSFAVARAHQATSKDAGTSIKPTTLRCEFRVNPLSIDVGKPRLSWVVESSARSQIQSAYEILVASTLEKLNRDDGDLWMTGKIVSDQSINVIYGGKPLETRMSCYWKVRVWDKKDKSSAYSKPAQWRMGLLAKSDWKGEWIGLKADTGDLKPSPYVRKDFNVSKRVKQASLYATARGLFIASLNGQRIGKDILSPEWTDYRTRIQYMTYDVSRLIKQGKNTVGAIIGDGWYHGYVGFGRRHGNYGKQTSILFQLHIEYADGSEEVVCTNASWRGSYGPVLYSDLLIGEFYDARKDIAGWDRPGFDANNWKPVDTFSPPEAKLVSFPTEPVHITKVFSGRNVSEPVKGTFIVDFGQNFAGFCRLKVHAPAGTTITLRHGEVLNPDGSLYTKNLRAAIATDVYVAGGKGTEVFEPHFTFHGFRYVEVTGYPGTLPSDAVEGCAINTDLPVTGTFACSDTLVNKLQSNIVWSQRGNFVSIPTDCPQRDERLGWMGDAQIFMRTAAFNMDVSSFMTKWMFDVDDSQSPDGAFMDTSPYIKGLGGEGAPGWGDAGIIIPWTSYLCYGDTKIISDHFDAMNRWMAYLAEKNPDFVRKNRLNNNYGDWLSINANTPKDLLATAFWAYDATLMSKMAKAIGRNEEAQKYAAVFDSVRAAFQKSYVSADGRIQGNTQTCYVLALAMDLLPASMRDRAAQYLLEDIQKKEGHLSTGFIGVKYLNPVLTESGHLDVAYRLLKNTTFPSWLYPVLNGATTIWERWDGWTKDKGFQDPGMNSFNHYSMGSVGEWLYRYVAGIDVDPAYPGYKHVIIHPYPSKGLTFANADYQSAHGQIKSHWKYADGKLKLEVTVPANTSATVYVPTSDPQSVREGNKIIKTNPDISFVRFEKGFAIYQVGSGVYSFLSKWEQ